MGYSTQFEGEVQIEPRLRPEHLAYLRRFSETRRLKRDPLQAALLPDPVRSATGLSIGSDGAYFVGAVDEFDRGDSSIIDINRAHAPFDDPLSFSLYCGWAPRPDGGALQWNGDDNFAEYVSWLEFLIEHFLGPWGYLANGRVHWQGDDADDLGSIFVRDNVVRSVQATIQVSDPFTDQ